MEQVQDSEVSGEPMVPRIAVVPPVPRVRTRWILQLSPVLIQQLAGRQLEEIVVRDLGV